MKAIILAAWEWSRLRPLTETKPKPLIKILGKSILEHNMEILKDLVWEFVIVVKYKKDIVKEAIGNEYAWIKVTYHEQWDFPGTGWALKWLTTDSDVLILNWDTIFQKENIEKLAKADWYWCLVKKVDNPKIYWIFKQDKNWYAEEIIEKPEEFVGNLANLWVYKFSKKIFKCVDEIKLSPRWEYEITDAINLFIKWKKFKLIESEWEFIDVWYPWDILKANSYFLDRLTENSIEWEIEDWAKIHGKIILGKWARIKSWVYIEWNVCIWENTVLWPNCYIRWNTVIWDNSHVWNACEIKNCAIWDNTKVAHLSYIWDSVLGDNVNIWAWSITANLRHDNWNVKALVKWKLIDTGLRKLGVVIWDNSRVGINTMFYPWRVLSSNSFTNPADIIK